MAKFLTERGSKKSRQIDGVPRDREEDHHDLHHDLTGSKGLLITNASQIPDRLLKFQTTTPLWEQERRQGDNIQQRSILRSEKNLGKSVHLDEGDERIDFSHEEGTLAPGLPGMSTTERRIPLHVNRSQERKDVEKILNQPGRKVAADDIPFFNILPKETSRFLEPAFSTTGKHVDDRDKEGDDEMKTILALRRSLVQEQALEDEDGSGSRSLSGSSSGEISNPEPENEVSELEKTPSPAESLKREASRSSLSLEFEPEGSSEEVVLQDQPMPVKSKSHPKSKPVPTMAMSSMPEKDECRCQESDYENPVLPNGVREENDGKPSFDMEKFNERFEETRALLCGDLISRIPKSPSQKPVVVPGSMPSKSSPAPGPPLELEPLPADPREKNCGCGLAGCGCDCACRCNFNNNQRKRHSPFPTSEGKCMQVEIQMEMTMDVSNNLIPVPIYHAKMYAIVIADEKKKTVSKPRPMSTKVV